MNKICSKIQWLTHVQMFRKLLFYPLNYQGNDSEACGPEPQPQSLQSYGLFSGKTNETVADARFFVGEGACGVGLLPYGGIDGGEMDVGVGRCGVDHG